jgi:hypothetical protein|tara:strand:+ start:31 stop:459 length:429 start_codon:yes stop_codon:yes gene_type:complete
MSHRERLNARQTKQHVYWIERDSIGLALYDASQNDKELFKSVTAVHEITLFYHKKALHFGVDSNGNSTLTSTSLMDEQSELPTQFHQYLVDKAIQLGYETKPDMIQMAPYFEQKFEKGIKEGKTFANRGRISGRRRIVQYDF